MPADALKLLNVARRNVASIGIRHVNAPAQTGEAAGRIADIRDRWLGLIADVPDIMHLWFVIEHERGHGRLGSEPILPVELLIAIVVGNETSDALTLFGFRCN